MLARIILDASLVCRAYYSGLAGFAHKPKKNNLNPNMILLLPPAQLAKVYGGLQSPYWLLNINPF